VASVMRSTRVVPTVDGPSALVTPSSPSRDTMSLTVRIVPALVPIATISAPRSTPARSAGVSS